MNRSIAIAAALALLALVIGAYMYPMLPEKVASHWDFQGNVNGYLDKTFGVFFPSMLTLFLIILFALVPSTDPLKTNIETFRKYFDGLIIVFTLFMVYLYLLTLAWNFGHRFNISQALSPAFAVLFYYMGVVVSRARRNWFIGIRTHWTLSSDVVWDSTHRLGGLLFRFCAAAALLGFFLPDYALFFVLVPVISASACLIVYSYLEYQKQDRLKHS